MNCKLCETNLEMVFRDKRDTFLSCKSCDIFYRYYEEKFQFWMSPITVGVGDMYIFASPGYSGCVSIMKAYDIRVLYRQKSFSWPTKELLELFHKYQILE